MRFFLLVPRYILWHYTSALKGTVTISRNVIWFLWHFFSIGLLLGTLFSPWQRIQEKHRTGLDIPDILGTFVVNIMMRVVGACLRLIIIAIGIVCIVAAFCLGILALVAWFLLPLLVICSFLYGVNLLMQPL